MASIMNATLAIGQKPNIGFVVSELRSLKQRIRKSGALSRARFYRRQGQSKHRLLTLLTSKLYDSTSHRAVRGLAHPDFIFARKLRTCRRSRFRARSPAARVGALALVARDRSAASGCSVWVGPPGAFRAVEILHQRLLEFSAARIRYSQSIWHARAFEIGR